LDLAKRFLQIVGCHIGKGLEVAVASLQRCVRFLELDGALLDPDLELIPGALQF
jgi:hypothetical protein